MDFDIQILNVKIKSTAPLIVHQFSQKAIKMIEDKQQGKAKNKKHDERVPADDYLNSLYCFKEGNPSKTGFPAVGFKAAMVRGAKQIGLVMKDVQCAMFVRGTDSSELVEIEGNHRMRTDMVRLPTGSADVRYRGEYPQWTATLPIEYNSGMISTEQVLSLVKAAGFAAGIGEWRPEKSRTGSYGTFTLVTK